MSQSNRERQTIRYEPRSENWRVPEFESIENMQEIEQHFEKHVGVINGVFHEIISDAVHIDVYHIKPTPERNYHTLFTIGMSTLPMNTPEGAEAFQYAELLIHEKQSRTPVTSVMGGEIEIIDLYYFESD